MPPLTSLQEAAHYRKSGLWRDLTVFELFRHNARVHAGKTAIAEAERRYTYAELLSLIDNVAGHLLRRGIGPGDVVAVQVPNSAVLPLMHLALNRIGALAMPIHDSWTQSELLHLLAIGRVRTAIVPSSYRGVNYPALYASLRRDLASLETVFSIGGATTHSEAFELLLEPSSVSDAELAARRPDPDAPSTLMLSSGTTNLPKPSVFSCNNIHALLHPFWQGIRSTPDDVVAALAPAGTGAIGYVYPILSPLLTGATAVILERWTEPEKAVDLIVHNGCTYATAVPAQLTQMLPSLQRRRRDEFKAFRCFTNAGAPLPPDVGRQIEELMACRIYVIYGATDGGVVCSTDIDDPQDRRLTTVGRPLPGRDVKLLDALQRPVAPDEPGEIYWRTADKSYGYLNDAEGTATVFAQDRFYRSGDLGLFDADGYLKIIGRAKDMIIRGGRNISPRLIEDLLIAHPDVAEVAVAAMPDPVLGERACAFVVAKPSATPTLADLLAFLKEQRAPTWQMPERLEVMEGLPRSAGGKVMKNKLTEFVTRRLEMEASATQPMSLRSGSGEFAERAERA
jgi:non-ribosomal peptide synthetase component E (peptide arylation enzyme)